MVVDDSSITLSLSLSTICRFLPSAPILTVEADNNNKNRTQQYVNSQMGEIKY